MRRCLRAFLVGLVTLSLLGGPAHACWRTRQARRCRPAVVAACPTPTWSECGDPCGVTVVVVESACVPAAVCCGESVAVVEAPAEGGISVGSATAPATEAKPQVTAAEPTPTAAEPTPDAVAESKPVQLERVPAPEPRPEGEAAGEVKPTSNEQPVAGPADGDAAGGRSVLAEEPEMEEPVAEPAEPDTEPKTAAGEEAEPEHQDYLLRIPNGYTCHYPRPNWTLPRRETV